MRGEKQRLRHRAIATRKSQVDKDPISRVIIDRVIRLPQYSEAGVVMWYVDVRDEVRTRHALPSILATDKMIVVPYCIDDELALFRLEAMDELSPGKFGIMEPKQDLRERDDKLVPSDSLDFILVPGVAFDSRGGRIGQGKGYYDRLLSTVRDSTFKVGIAYDCQLIDRVPTDPHDVPMDMIVTETLLISVH